MNECADIRVLYCVVADDDKDKLGLGGMCCCFIFYFRDRVS
jgi:hypothetical protein